MRNKLLTDAHPAADNIAEMQQLVSQVILVVCRVLDQVACILEGGKNIEDGTFLHLQLIGNFRHTEFRFLLGKAFQYREGTDQRFDSVIGRHGIPLS